MNPTAAEIERVMRDTGMDRIQAINHLRCRYLARRMVRNGRGL